MNSNCPKEKEVCWVGKVRQRSSVWELSTRYYFEKFEFVENVHEIRILLLI